MSVRGYKEIRLKRVNQRVRKFQRSKIYKPGKILSIESIARKEKDRISLAIKVSRQTKGSKKIENN